jgi:hypothetical protein
MPKVVRKPKTRTGIALVDPRTPWSCQHHPGYSEIEAYIEAFGPRKIVVEVRATAGVEARAVTRFIVEAVNGYARTRQLAGEMMAALETCQGESLGWSAEHDAEVVLRRAREMGL